MSKKRSISTKYALWFSAISLTILVLVMVSVIAVFRMGADTLRDTLREGTRRSFEKTQYTTMHNLAEYLRRHIAPSLYRLDIEDINRAIRDIRKGMAVDSFRIADATGKVLTDGTAENSSFGMLLPIDEKMLRATPVVMQPTGKGHRVLFWIAIAGYSVGYGEMVFSDDPLQQSLAQQEKTVLQIWEGFTAKFMTITLVAALAIAFLAGIISIIFARTFSLPLVQLSDATKKITAGDPDYRVHISSDDEIGELAGSFNDMVENLQARTTELAEMNKALQTQIEERTAAEFALAEEKERLAVTLHSIVDGVLTTDTEGRVLLINTVAEALTGWRREESSGMPIGEIFRIFNEETSEPLDNPVDVVRRSGTAVAATGNTTLKDRSGNARSIAYSCAPIRQHAGNIIGTVLVVQDITERHKMEKEMLKVQKLESVGILAGGIAHDFNNILTGVIGNISLAMTSLSEQSSASQRLEEAEKAALRAKDLTQQLLTFSRGGTPIRKNVSLETLIVDSANFALTGSNVKCTFSLSPELWPAHVDEGQVSQVIQNLVINADQAMPHGGIISIVAHNASVRPDSGLPLAAGNYIKISVKDQGIGISKKNAAKIFDPYFTTKKTGEGLGLATTYSIVKNHNGYITLESQEGIGTTFFMYLPAAQDDIATEIKVGKEQDLSGCGKILIMDDEVMVRSVARDMLSRLGYEVEVAENGHEAVRLFGSAREASERPFDAVLMDLTIPGGMGGQETIEKLRAIDNDVRAIVSSGYSNDPIMANYRDYGFSGVVSKPYNLQKLGSELRRVLGEKSSKI